MIGIRVYGTNYGRVRYSLTPVHSTVDWYSVLIREDRDGRTKILPYKETLMIHILWAEYNGWY